VHAEIHLTLVLSNQNYKWKSVQYVTHFSQGNKNLLMLVDVLIDLIKNTALKTSQQNKKEVGSCNRLFSCSDAKMGL